MYKLSIKNDEKYDVRAFATKMCEFFYKVKLLHNGPVILRKAGFIVIVQVHQEL